MKISDIYRRIERYLRNDDMRPRIVNFQDHTSLIAFRDHFNVGTTVFKTPSDFSKADEDILTENLYAEIQSFKGNLFLIGFTSQLRLKGRDALHQFIAQIAHMTLKSGKLVLVCYGCLEMLHFDDTRIQGLVYSADDTFRALPQLRFVGEDISIRKGQKVTKGIDKIGLLVETVNADTLVIRTKKLAQDYPNSMFHIEELIDAYAALCNIDSATSGIGKALGKVEQWAFALKEISSAGSWNSLVAHLFGSPYALDLAVGQWDRFTDDMQWLYFIALKLFGAQKNWCLNQAANAALSPKDMVRKIYRSILGEDCHSATFVKRYRERKQLLQQMFDVEDDAEVIDYIKMTKQHQRDAIRYLTNNTKLEKEAIIDLISVYAEEYTPQELRSILEEVYPDLAAYLDACKIFGDDTSATAILATSDPAEQQLIGRGASGFDRKIWDSLKQVIAFRGLMAKFSQNEDLKQKLLNTGDAYLVECAYGDVIWACGRRLNEIERLNTSNWRGQNILGFTLMEVREALRV